MAVLIQKESGGNLAEVLEKVATTARERFRLKKQVAVHTAQGRMTGWILSFLPVALARNVSRELRKHEHILWTDPTGQKMLGTAVCMDVTGRASLSGKSSPPSTSERKFMGLAALAFIAVFLLISSLGALVFYRQAVLGRLAQVRSRAVDASLLGNIAPARGSRIEKLVKPFEKVVPRTKEDVSTVQKRLARAGYR